MHFALCGFFCYELSRTYALAHLEEYLENRKDLTYFGVLTLILSVATITMTIVCLRNFGKGLKPYIHGQRLARNLEGNYEMETQGRYTDAHSLMWPNHG